VNVVKAFLTQMGSKRKMTGHSVVLIVVLNQMIRQKYAAPVMMRCGSMMLDAVVIGATNVMKILPLATVIAKKKMKRNKKL
jgi:hypothetical protein